MNIAPMKLPIVSLTYRSRAHQHSIDARVLASILASAQEHNVDNDVTGALAYGGGYFVQVLEGPEGAVAETMERITRDPRHDSLEIIGPLPVSRREFPDWCMASLMNEPDLQPVIAKIVDSWDYEGRRASRTLAHALKEQSA